jgi:nucleoside-diphosphate-sugar epimerase
MIIIGDGLLANAFQEINISDDFILFASGVSNSNEINNDEFNREKFLIQNAITKYKSKIFIYFSSCDVIYADKLSKAYYYHKLDMEKYIIENINKYYIFRLPQVIGKSKNKKLLINYFLDSINNNKEIIAFSNAYKNIISTNSILTIVRYIINIDTESNKIINIINPNYYSIREIISTIEKIVNKKALVKYIENGFKPQYKYNNILNNIKLDFDENYLFNKIKYYNEN